MYTLEIYKIDRRCAYGMRFVGKYDYECKSKEDMEGQIRDRPEASALYPTYKKGYIFKVVETYVTKTNLMSGAKFQERYDTPHFCSPSSESYWSM